MCFIVANDIAVRTGDFTEEDSEKTEVLVEQIFWYADYTYVYSLHEGSLELSTRGLSFLILGEDGEGGSG